MDIFSDEEPDLMALELVKEFDNLTKKFYNVFDDDLIELNEGSDMYLGLRSEVFREVVYVVQHGSSDIRPNKDSRVRKITRKVGPVPVSVEKSPDNSNKSTIERLEQNSSEDVIITDKKVKIVSQLPIINRKQDIKVLVHDDNSVTISYLNYEGKRYSSTSVIPYYIDSETAKATYKNGILEVTFDRE
jgi:HSP20 family molecular chaperone IbpA